MSRSIGGLMEVYDLVADTGDAAAWLEWRAAGLAARTGALGVQHWRSIDDPLVAVVTCDVETPEEASRPQWVHVSGGPGLAPRLRARYCGEQILPGALRGDATAGGLLFLAMDVDPAVDGEFNDWNDTEHFPRLAAVEGVLAARRFRCGPEAQKYLAVYHATRPDIIDSPAWLNARETPWARRIRTFTSRRMRIVGRRVQGS